ncbi:branched-chain amino acid ABC transporter substrate-binding protein [Clostridium botulinum]|uniref:Branched-chain amino acid ABC transporter substrate-binding protein n=1 Tax=Clostridium botulinum TaxID=1491 RepID=A0A6M0SR01_CLOBO|nr:branched-chain amino acid ABC transporter substrate-binding protein [Clostridium botulinum]NFE95830.1 branched-chain amino acid ABC transporter substrate-binding protein [Clostridium botulinum]
MAIDNVNMVDAIGVDEKNQALRLMITDHLEWKNKYLSETDHLLMLQNKINSYLSYIESEQYKETYPNINFKILIIEIHFKYESTENCEKFLKVVQDQVRQFGIKIESYSG